MHLSEVCRSKRCEQRRRESDYRAGHAIIATALRTARDRDTSRGTQCTEEWHNARARMITASEAQRALQSAASQRALIAEKVRALSLRENCNRDPSRMPASFAHGVRYEPVAKAFYERLRGLRAPLSEFGCVRNPQHAYIGASPDGVVTDESSPFYGRVVEIKCPHSRALTDGGEQSIPRAYWVQMQVQMACLNLDACDYLECDIQTFRGKPSQEFYAKQSLLCGVRAEFALTIPKTRVVSRFWFRWRNSAMKTEPSTAAAAIIEEEEKQINQWLEQTKHELGGDSVCLRSMDYWEIKDHILITVPRSRTWFEQHCVDTLHMVWKTMCSVALENDTATEQDTAVQEDTAANDAYGAHDAHDALNSIARVNNDKVIDCTDEMLLQPLPPASIADSVGSETLECPKEIMPFAMALPDIQIQPSDIDFTDVTF